MQIANFASPPVLIETHGFASLSVIPYIHIYICQIVSNDTKVLCRFLQVIIAYFTSPPVMIKTKGFLPVFSH